MINGAKFDACTSSSFRGVKTDTQTDGQTDRIALRMLDKGLDNKQFCQRTFLTLVLEMVCSNGGSYAGLLLDI